jgi:hypothetical protein
VLCSIFSSVIVSCYIVQVLLSRRHYPQILPLLSFICESNYIKVVVSRVNIVPEVLSLFLLHVVTKHTSIHGKIVSLRKQSALVHLFAAIELSV